ncbi:MotA/TolQ/ExbB proton channel family protein [Vibrio hepatarius]|uniref:MotA/TolQ/ExbB proton channel family protein n=1 Tax=Vibrio hepatarius TaxID=171383 RepID=UPI001C08288F|nr:MotA/TolQ/ExbB proton channel family protein [Vibrio hepatarius]MBU2895731.1 MotA/TolQ/ExbB proton channel family protein [Vibrio hepatarius]
MLIILNTIEQSAIMRSVSDAIAQLGPMKWPLLICSILALALLMDRLFHLICTRTYISNQRISQGLRQFKNKNQTANELSIWGTKKSLSRQLAALLHSHRNIPREQREDLATIWIDKHERRLGTGLNILALISVVTPLLGLLGTVLGLMEMFSKIASTNQAINPSMLAQGLGMALMTTIVGLFIAIPALVGFHTLKMWSNHKIAFIIMLANQINLVIDGVVNSTISDSESNSEQRTPIELAYSASAGVRRD